LTYPYWLPAGAGWPWILEVTTCVHQVAADCCVSHLTLTEAAQLSIHVETVISDGPVCQGSPPTKPLTAR
jgi:hypothetical protein